MTNAHYEKYKDTIKKVSRRNYRKRIVVLNEFLSDKSNWELQNSEGKEKSDKDSNYLRPAAVNA